MNTPSVEEVSKLEAVASVTFSGTPESTVESRIKSLRSAEILTEVATVIFFPLLESTSSDPVAYEDVNQ